MAVVASVDYATRRVYLAAATVDANLDTLDIYREVRALRRTNEVHRKYKPMVEAGGNLVKITGISYTPAYVRLLYGCRIVPYNVSHKIRLVRDTFTDDGLAGRDCFDRTPLSVSVDVDIDVDYPEIEIRQIVISGSTGPSAAQIAEAILAAAIISPIASDTKKVNSINLTGLGTTQSPWGPV
jgi:hypothetical protein